jgi:hypothetical protein
MKIVQLACNTPAPRLEAELAAIVKGLFDQWPELLGFSVQPAEILNSRRSLQIEDELCIADFATHPWLTQEQRFDLRKEVAIALSELLEEVPAAREVLNRRTFTRTLH